MNNPLVTSRFYVVLLAAFAGALPLQGMGKRLFTRMVNTCETSKRAQFVLGLSQGLPPVLVGAGLLSYGALKFMTAPFEASWGKDVQCAPDYRGFTGLAQRVFSSSAFWLTTLGGVFGVGMLVRRKIPNQKLSRWYKAGKWGPFVAPVAYFGTIWGAMGAVELLKQDAEKVQELLKK